MQTNEEIKPEPNKVFKKVWASNLFNLSRHYTSLSRWIVTSSLIPNFLKYVFVRCDYKNIEPKNDLTMGEKEELERLRRQYIKTFEKYVDEGKDPWMTAEQLSKTTGTTTTQVSKVVMNFNDFVRDSRGRLNSKENYLKNEKLLKRITDILNGRIK